MKNEETNSLISFQKIMNIAMNEPKLEIISKFKLLNISVLNKFLTRKYVQSWILVMVLLNLELFLELCI